ncbi:MAG: hypothetical protein ACXWH7_12155 [Thermoanaerobaculia bacterium]
MTRRVEEIDTGCEVFFTRVNAALPDLIARDLASGVSDLTEVVADPTEKAGDPTGKADVLTERAGDFTKASAISRETSATSRKESGDLTGDVSYDSEYAFMRL